MKKSAGDQDQDQQDQETDQAVKADKKPETKADEPKDVSSEDHKRKSDKLRSDKGDEGQEAGSDAEQKHTDKKPKVEPKEEAAGRSVLWYHGLSKLPTCCDALLLIWMHRPDECRVDNASQQFCNVCCSIATQ